MPANKFEYGARLRDAHSGYLAKGQTLPTSASDLGNDGPKSFGKTLGRIQIAAVAAEPVSIPATKNLTFELQGCATETGSYAAVPGCSVAVAGEKTFAAGEVICTVPVSEDAFERFGQINITSDGATTGKVDVFLELLP